MSETTEVTFTVLGGRLTDAEDMSLAEAFSAWCDSVGREPTLMHTRTREDG